MPREKGSKNVNAFHWWTEEELNFLREQYPLHDRNELLVLYNERFNQTITKDALKCVLGRNKIKSGRTGHWQNGQEACNKGKTRDEYMSHESQENCRKTCFSGEDRSINNSNHNEVPIGTEAVFDGYVIVKTDKPDGISSRRWWKFKHHIIWEEANGPMPKGHHIIFADGNKLNFNLDNLVLVSNAELAVMNKCKLYFKGNADATKCGVTLSKIMIRRKQRAKK